MNIRKYFSHFKEQIVCIIRLVVTTPHYPLLILLSIVSGALGFLGIPMLIFVLEYVMNSNEAVQNNILIARIDSFFHYINFEPGFYPVLSVAAMLIIGSQLIAVLPELIAKWSSNKLCARYTKEMFSAYQEVDWLWLTGANSGEFNYVLLRETSHASSAHLYAQRLVVAFIQCVIYFVLAIQLSFGCVLLMFTLYSVLLFINYKNAIIVKKLKNKYLSIIQEMANAFSVFQQNKKFFKTCFVHSKTVNSINSNVEALNKNLNVAGACIVCQNAWTQIFGLVVLFILILLHSKLGLNYATLMVLLLVFNRLSPYLNAFSCAYTGLNSELPMYLSMKGRIDEMKKNMERSGNMVFAAEKSIDFVNVGFSYPNGNQVFENLSFKITVGNTVAFIGSSGSGKSTILDLILGLVKPYSGEIRYGMISHRDLDVMSFRKIVAYVSQEPTLIGGTLRSNLLPSCGEYDDEYVQTICRKAHIWDLIKSLPRGLDTEIGENGIKLSGGQKQRVILARALFMKPKILILDEATSDLDLESEMIIQQTIDELRDELTIIIVAHRLATVKNADMIYVLENGTICESGSYAQLLEQKGRLYYLDSLQ